MRDDCPICGEVHEARHFLDHLLACARKARALMRALCRTAEDYQNFYVVDGESTRDALSDAIKAARALMRDQINAT